MSSGEVFNNNKFNKMPMKPKFKLDSKNKYEETPEKNNTINDIKKRISKKAIAATLIGAGLVTGATAWAFGSNSKEEYTNSNPNQIEDTQSSNSSESSIDSKYQKFADWEPYSYKNQIQGIEASTIDKLSENEILLPEDMSEADVNKLASFYMDDIVYQGTLYGYITEDRTLNLASYKKSQEPLYDKTDSAAKGQAMLDAIYDAKIAAYSYQGKEAMTILRYANLTKSIGNEQIICSGVCANTIDKIHELESESKAQGHEVTVADPEKKDLPKFTSFIETIPEMTDYNGDKYHDGKIIEYNTNNQEMYILIAWPDEKRIDYKGEEIKMPIAIMYSKSPDALKEDLKDFVIY